MNNWFDIRISYYTSLKKMNFSTLDVDLTITIIKYQQNNLTIKRWT